MSKKNTQKKEFAMSREEYIEHLSMKSNEVHISCKNSKTGSCCNDLAFPTCTCRDDAPCKQSGKCYCLHGTQRMCSVLSAYYRNLRLYTNDPEDFWTQVRFIIKHRPLPLFRYMDCGEIPDYAFITGMVETAKMFPNIKFMSFTKKYEQMNKWLDGHDGKLPDNLNILYSAWDKNWKVSNPYGLGVAYVDFKDSSLNPEFPEHYQTCPNQKDKNITCGMCQKCFNKKMKAVVFKQH